MAIFAELQFEIYFLATYEDDLQESVHLCAAIAYDKRIFISGEDEDVGSYQCNQSMTVQQSESYLSEQLNKNENIGKFKTFRQENFKTVFG